MKTYRIEWAAFLNRHNSVRGFQIVFGLPNP